MIDNFYISQNKLAIAFYQLSALLKAGTSLHIALKIVASRQSGKLKEGFNLSSIAISQGKTLSSSSILISDKAAIALVLSGEASGTLPQALEAIVIYMQKKLEIRQKIISALIYPLIVLFLTIILVLFLLSYVFPKIIPLLQSFKVGIPLTTRILIVLSRFLNENALFLGMAFLLLPGLIVLALRYEKVKNIARLYLSKIPFCNYLIRITVQTRVCYILSLLLSHGVPITKALSLTKETIHFRFLSEQFSNIQISCSQGKKISVAFLEYGKFFDPLISDMIAIGEQTGKVSENLLFLSEYYNQQIDRVIKRLSVLLEPFLMIVMGFIVGFVALSIIVPLYNITSGLKG